jgi:mannose-6-phosphate isomerase-like protein (cupin superfamily)
MTQAPATAASVLPSTAPALRMIAPEEGRSWWIMNNHQLHKLNGSDTHGALSLWFESFGPGEGPPPHVHGREEEIFVVLEGEVTFFGADRSSVARPGSVVLVPRGQQHTFRNTGTSVARMVIMVTPAGFEDFFAAAAYHGGDRQQRPAPTGDDVQRLLDHAGDYGLTFCPPA